METRRCIALLTIYVSFALFRGYGVVPGMDYEYEIRYVRDVGLMATTETKQEGPLTYENNKVLQPAKKAVDGGTRIWR